MTALAKAIKNVGSARNLAKGLGISPVAVSRWKIHHKSVVPASRVIDVFALTGITPHELRPDLYPNPTDGLPPDQSTQKGV